MLEIKRYFYSVIALDTRTGLGIAFPASEKVLSEEFIKEVNSRTFELDNIVDIVLLFFDSKQEEYCIPMQKFLAGRDPSVLDDDKIVKDLHMFYFKNAVPQIVPRGINYIFVG